MLDPTERTMPPKIDGSCKRDDSSSTSSRSRNSNKNNHKVIRFASSLQHFETLCRDDYTESEVKNTWYSAGEQKVMKSKQNKLVKRMDKGKKPKGDESFRGMENLALNGYQEMMHRKHRCIDSVMDEQERQWKLNVVDWDRIKELAMECSQECIAEALKFGEKDEIEAKKALKKPWLPTDSSHSEGKDSSHSESTDCTDCSDISFTLRRQLSKPSINKSKSRRNSRQTKRMDPPGKTLPLQKTILYVKVTSPYISPNHFKLRTSSTVAA